MVFYVPMSQAFDLLDTNGNGFLTLEDLRDASMECSLNFSNNTLREMLQEADKHGDGKINLADFTDIMLLTSKFKYASWRNIYSFKMHLSLISIESKELLCS